MDWVLQIVDMSPGAATWYQPIYDVRFSMRFRVSSLSYAGSYDKSRRSWRETVRALEGEDPKSGACFPWKGSRCWQRVQERFHAAGSRWKKAKILFLTLSAGHLWGRGSETYNSPTKIINLILLTMCVSQAGKKKTLRLKKKIFSKTKTALKGTHLSTIFNLKIQTRPKSGWINNDVESTLPAFIISIVKCPQISLPPIRLEPSLRINEEPFTSVTCAVLVGLRRDVTCMRNCAPGGRHLAIWNCWRENTSCIGCSSFRPWLDQIFTKNFGGGWGGVTLHSKSSSMLASIPLPPSRLSQSLKKNIITGSKVSHSGQNRKPSAVDCGDDPIH